MAAFQPPKMTQKAFSRSQTNDDKGHLTPPITRAVRPLPRRAQGQCHSGTGTMFVTQPLAGPSRLANANALATPFPETSSRHRHNYQNRSPPYQCLVTSERTWLASPSMPPTQLDLARPESPTESPPKKRLRIKMSDRISKGKQKAGPNSEVAFDQGHSTNLYTLDCHERETTTAYHSYRHSNLQPARSIATFDQNQSTVAISQSSHAVIANHRISLHQRAAVDGLDSEGWAEEFKCAHICGGKRWKAGSEGPSSGRSRPDDTECKLAATSCTKSRNSVVLESGPIPAAEGATEELSYPVLESLSPKSKPQGADLDVLLRKYRSILPPHVCRASTAVPPFRLCGFKPLLGRRIDFAPVAKISAGNGTSSLEVVRSISALDCGFGFPEESLWVRKTFKACRKDVERAIRESALTQLKRECAAYRRIEEAMGVGDIGFWFIMNVEAVVTINFDPCLILPLMWKDLAHLIDKSKGKIARRDSRRILAQTVIGLATLHSIGIIHSDIKPANIFLDAQGKVKIGDFGLSHITESIESLSVSVPYSTTRHGTPGYMAPEKIDWRGYSYPVDYWSIGWVLYDLVSEKKRLMDALVDDDTLVNWAANYRMLEDRKKFFESERFDDHTLDLLCGLLDPNPQTRMGIKEMLLHDFFLKGDGSSDFSGMEEALSRPEHPISEEWDKPATCRSKVSTYTSEPNDDSRYRWINPYGAYVAGSKLHDYGICL